MTLPKITAYCEDVVSAAADIRTGQSINEGFFLGFNGVISTH